MRRAPRWFTDSKWKDAFHRWWPWGLSFSLAIMYQQQPEPFEEVGSSLIMRLRKPLLKATEFAERHDLDPETFALELPPDQLFGPLSFEDQMKFTLEALRADNELGDGYLARMCIDNMDMSLDAPPPTDKLERCGGRELLDYAVADFTETRQPRKHKFFTPDAFIRMINWIANRPRLAEHFIVDHDGVNLLFRALKTAAEPYARIMVLRCLTLFAMQQRNDGDIERRVLAGNHIGELLIAYKDSSGDPTETRLITMLLSSIMRHYPAAFDEKVLEDLTFHTVHNLNIARYKGLPHHLRMIADIRRLPLKNKAVVDKMLYDAELLPVALGIVDVFPEYFEVCSSLVELLHQTRHLTKPFDFLEYRALNVFAKLYGKYHEEDYFKNDGTMRRIAELSEWILNDPECKRCFDPSVASKDLNIVLHQTRKLVDDWHALERDKQQQLAVAQAA